jgi:hypothetical protein
VKRLYHIIGNGHTRINEVIKTIFSVNIGENAVYEIKSKMCSCIGCIVRGSFAYNAAYTAGGQFGIVVIRRKADV